MQPNDNRPIDVYETEHEGYFDTEGFIQWRNSIRVLRNISSVRDYLLSSHNAMTAIFQPLDTSITNEAHTEDSAETEDSPEPEEQYLADLDGLPDLEEIFPYQGPLTEQQTIFMNELTRIMYGYESLPFTNEFDEDVADRNNE